MSEMRRNRHDHIIYNCTFSTPLVPLEAQVCINQNSRRESKEPLGGIEVEGWTIKTHLPADMDAYISLFSDISSVHFQDDIEISAWVLE